MTVKEKAEENYTKVYLKGDMSLDTEEKYFAYTKGYCKGYTDALTEGRKRKCKTPITPQDLMSELGNSIRNYCLKKNIDQSDFAKLLKVKKSTVSWWVTGKVFPSVENLVKIINLIKED